MKRFLVPTLGLAGTLLALFSGCAAGQDIDSNGGSGGGGAGGSTAGLCVPGKQEVCPCPGGSMGVQACNAQGTAYSACECGTGGSGAGGGTGGSDPCGDGFCAGEEDCSNCDADCGLCAPCDIAPSCANAQIPPAAMTHVAELDAVLMPLSKQQIAARLQARVEKQEPGVRLVMAALSAPRAGETEVVTAMRAELAKHPALAARLDHHLTAAGGRAMKLDTSDWQPPVAHPLSGEFPGGTPECGAPLLRIRAATVTVHEEDDDFANDIVYCALTSEAKSASEIRVTPQTPNLDEGDSHTYPIEAGVFWGQMAPETPGGNILLTYDCFEADTSNGYQSLIDGIGQAATAIGGVAGSYGWVFTVIGAVAPVIGDVVGMDGDDHLFNAQQTVPLDKQLDLTNGRFWSVRRAGTHLNSDWDWELRIEAWGCAQYGTL